MANVTVLFGISSPEPEVSFQTEWVLSVNFLKFLECIIITAVPVILKITCT